jgi:hypothetical protein
MSAATAGLEGDGLPVTASLAGGSGRRTIRARPVETRRPSSTRRSGRSLRVEAYALSTAGGREVRTDDVGESAVDRAIGDGPVSPASAETSPAPDRVRPP